MSGTPVWVWPFLVGWFAGRATHCVERDEGRRALLELVFVGVSLILWWLSP